MGVLGWLGGYTVASFAVAWIVVRIVEAVTDPFLAVASHKPRKPRFSFRRGRE